MSGLPPLPADLVGQAAGPVEHEIDARWLMAYAACLGETGPEYLDSTRPGGPLAHPLFPVCYEWPAALALRRRLYAEAVAARTVHATHDLRLHRRPRAGDRLRTTARVVAAEPRAPGAYVLTRFETVDASGALVSVTDYGSLVRGVGCEGARALPEAAEPPPPAGAAASLWTAPVAVGAELAHTYTECARIWNPIHTDRAAALAAGLPGIILHGTATLALAVSAVLRREPAGAAAPVRRLAARFSGMVPLPAALEVRGTGATEAPEGRWTAFAVRLDDRPVLDRGGLLIAREP
jgi:acyl dehydratase